MRPLTLIAMSIGLVVVVTLAARAAEPSPSTKPANSRHPGKSERIVALETYYADLYAKPLAESDRLSRLIAVMSLAKIHGSPLTEKLLGVLSDKDPLVAQIAWEALHARQTSLSDEQRAQWLAAGVAIARRKGFPGGTVAPLLAALPSQPPSKYKSLADFLLQVASENDPATPAGKPAIDAARSAIVAWGDPKLIQILLARTEARPKLGQRVQAMLSGLPNAPEPSTDAAKLRAAWGKYLRESKLAPPATQPVYAGKSEVLPEPAAIEDPGDPKWRKELELPKLDLSNVDLAICVDATGSMRESNDYVTAYVETVMRMLRLLSNQVRGGAVYYRHEVDPDLMRQCCKDVPTQKGNFHTKTVPLTAEPKALVKLMKAQKLAGKTGHDNGAYTAGIATAIRDMKWAGKGKRIIACTGDALATPGSEKALVELATKAKADGYMLIFVVRDNRAAKAVKKASEAATGLEPIVYQPDIDKLAQAGGADKAASAIDAFKDTAFETMTTRVVELSLPEDYRDRAKPLMTAILPILQAQDDALLALKGVEAP